MKYNEQQQIRSEKVKELKKLLPNYSYEYKIAQNNSLDLEKEYSSFNKEELEEMKVKASIMGRIKTIRGQGKTMFLTMDDEFGSMQVYLRKDAMSEKDWMIIKLFDLGDMVYFEGTLMKTHTNALTLRALEITFIIKSISPLPEKFHGLKDEEEISRRRYVDLIMSKDSRDRFKIRSQILNEIRKYLSEKGFLEFETPILHSILGGAAAKPFITHHNALGEDFYLRIAPELYLKRLIVGGFPKVFEMGKLFRNEGISYKHNPEFTSLETYEAFADYKDALNLAQSIINHLAKEILGTEEIEYNDQKISLKLPFKQEKMSTLVKEITGVDFEEITFEEAKIAAKKHDVPLEKHYSTKGYILNAFFEEKVEDKLIQPTFVIGYPVEVSPLAKLSHGSTEITDRFELFIGAREYANGFSELNDSEQQYERFLEQLKEKELGNDEATEMDKDYIEALQYGLPPTAGLGIGIDRLVMLLTNSKSIREVLLFPTLKSKK